MATKKKMTNNQKIEKSADKMIALMEEGKLNWNKPWKGMGNGPCNYETKRPYRGWNRLITMFSGFSSPFYLTFNQIKKRGGNVIKGSKGLPIILWKPFKVEVMKDGIKKEETRFFVNTFTVFNEEQIEGIEFTDTTRDELKDYGTVEALETVINNMPEAPQVDIRIRDRACYIPSWDKVEMPEKGQFKTLEQYYATYVHELAHSTGHETRLNRATITSPNGFGSHEYSYEELIAEFSASFILSLTGVETEQTEKNSAAYLQGWVSKLKDDKMMLYKAARDAEKVVDYILGNSKDEE